MEFDVTVQIAGEDVLAGRLYQNVRHGDETVTFSYDPSYLNDPRSFSLAPDMPLGAGSFHSSGLRQLRAFEDCMPDRWGRNLMLRAERSRARDERRTPRTLFEADMLAGVNDEARQGALRIWNDAGEALSPVSDGVPRETSIPVLLDAADRASKDMNADIRDLLAAGSSLGGARPKASIRDEQGCLCIAKFPKADEGALDDVCAWEHVALRLMAELGMSVPASRLLRIGTRAVLLMRRFDRNGSVRVPYISGLTAVQGEDGGRYSYLELAEFIEEEGSRPTNDLHELWTRALFSCAVGNTDNHLRNYGFLRERAGWRLSPAFDVNPTPGSERKYLATGLDFDNREAEPEVALAVREYFRLDGAAARAVAARMARVMGGWRRIARADGISEASIEFMADCFESGIRKLKALAR
ncbi:MAG TPA: HipA domain-containing protein [Candidatus Coprovicinus avistercoris]|uniref:HipA domain-containing protein n=1 Tax=Candidatus Coprovicinus avistercoris TaxID=2840754 RepID=A0A9D1HWW1_9ACTN|nr:HipA domain-containing protein [Candidatus Coprovicinus avistercoris]